MGHIGTAADFKQKVETQLDPYKVLGENLVFISDGSLWLRQMMESSYPGATLILDMYHRTGPGAYRGGRNGSFWGREAGV